jgi:hypothetical protein
MKLPPKLKKLYITSQLMQNFVKLSNGSFMKINLSNKTIEIEDLGNDFPNGIEFIYNNEQPLCYEQSNTVTYSNIERVIKIERNSNVLKKTSKCYVLLKDHLDFLNDINLVLEKELLKQYE